MENQEELQFRCRMCQYIATSKMDMADHFINVHAAVEIVDPSLNPAEADGEFDEDPTEDVSEGDELEKLEDAGENSGSQGKKTGFRSNAIRSTISHLVRAAEQACKVEGPAAKKRHRDQQRSNVKSLSKTVHAVGRELRKHKMKRKFDDFVVFNEGKDRSIILLEDGAQRVSAKKKKKKKSLEEDVKVKLIVSSDEFSQKMDKEMQKWNNKWNVCRKAKLVSCSNGNCSLELPGTEMKLHKMCHMVNYYGFRCPHCNYMHSRWRNMRCHIFDDHDGIEKPLFKCDWHDCSVSFTALWGLKRHVQKDHIRSKVIKMCMTGYKGSDEEDDDDDEAAEMKEKPKLKRAPKAKRRRRDDGDTGRKKFQRMVWLPSCTVCEAKNIPVEEMESHMSRHTIEGSQNVNCAECTLIFDTQDKLKAHMGESHKRMLKLYRCNICNKYAGDRQFDFRKHQLTHEDMKPCMCEVCGKLMSTRYNLKVHRKRVHATDEEKTIQCDHCPYRCADTIVLKDHLRFQHNLMWNGDPYRDAEKLASFKCNMCSYMGKKESSLAYHMRVHTENRQFRCTICPYASKTKNNLILHMRTHGGMKPVQCPHCQYRGATNKVVNEHIMSKHNGGRFRCPCGWSTAYSGNMWKHMQFHREKGDAYQQLAEGRYGQTAKTKRRSKKTMTTTTTVPMAMGAEEIVVATNIQTATIETVVTAMEHANQDPRVIIHPEGTVIPIMGEDLQLNNLAQAVCMTANKGVPHPVSLQTVPGQVDQSEDSQAASFLSKLAQAVSSGQQVEKQVTVGGEMHGNDSTEQAIQELILW